MSASETSREAYHSIEPELGRKQRAVYAFVRKYGPVNNRELSELTGWPVNQITPRVLELRRPPLEMVVSAGLAVDPVTGKRAERWTVRE